MRYRPIMSTLGYVISPDGESVLMVHRVAREADEQFGKYNGLGGHMKPDEDIATCMVREIREEAGIEVLSIKDVTPVPHNGCRPPKRRRG